MDTATGPGHGAGCVVGESGTGAGNAEGVVELARDERAVWVLCKGSRKKSYQAQVDPSS